MSATSLRMRPRWRGRSGILRTVSMCVVMICLSSLVDAPSIQALSRMQGTPYSGNGGLVLPDSEPLAARIDAAQCAGCRWKFTTPCSEDPRALVDRCRVLQSGCDADVLHRLWWAESGRSWRQHGLVCVSPAGPLSIERVRERLTSEVVRELPALRPACAPVSGAIEHLPLRCSSGQSPLTHTVQITESQASITADLTPEWQWELRRAAGGVRSGPRGSSAHVAWLVPMESGRWVVTVRTVWRARLRISGIPLTGAGFQVEERASTSVRVARARAHLGPSLASSGRSGADVRAIEAPWQTTRTKARPSDFA
jgi:hypothetical protein